jgi:hypothetical protein
MSDPILTLVITEPRTTPSGAATLRMVTLDEHGCEVGYYGLDAAGYGYGPDAEHPDRDLFGWPEGIGLGFAFSNNVEEGWACPSVEAGVEAACHEMAERIDGGWDFATACARPDEGGRGTPDEVADHLAHGDVWIDRGWEDAAGFPVPPTTAPDCDRTCLPCQDGDHPACGMGCHDEQLNDHAAGEHEAVPVETCPGCMDDAADEDALLAHEAAHEAGSYTLVRRHDCAECADDAAPSPQEPASAGRLAPRSATVELRYLADRFVAYRVVVLVADEFGFVEERHVWNGSERAEGERAAEIARKTLGAVAGLAVIVR